jgi:energy-coupling factor transporter ATP-binding protein EcfA2
VIDLDDVFPLRSAQLSAAFEAAPKRLLSASVRVDYGRSLPLEDPRYVQTARARGELFERHFQLALGYDGVVADVADIHPDGQHLLLFGHVGCGKSTELRHLAEALHHPQRYWVVHVDLQALIDTNNARYSDIWLAVVGELMQRLAEDGIAIPEQDLMRFHSWFSEHIVVEEHQRETGVAAAMEAGVGGMIPFLAKLFSRVTGTLRSNSAQKEMLRTVIRETYQFFAASLNDLISATERALRQTGKARHVLFVVDGIDRFRPEDWRRLFHDEVNQITQIKCFAVYSVPMALKVSGLRLSAFKRVVLPMVKLVEADGITHRLEAFDALRQVVLKRCHHSLFADVAALDRLIEFSGGHLRDLLRLLDFACTRTTGPMIDRGAVDAAIAELGVDYRDNLTEAHYRTLVKADMRSTNLGTSDDLADLVERGALLEYNAGSWRQTHPVVRELAGYQYAASIERPSTVMEAA